MLATLINILAFCYLQILIFQAKIKIVLAFLNYFTIYKIGGGLMKKVLFFLILIVVLQTSLGWANTHYVSKTGLDEYPYTSWGTAADSIQKGINAASYGDTVRVGAGIYQEYGIIMTPGITMIGAGIDSCVIGRGWKGEEDHKGATSVIEGADSSSIEGFQIDGWSRSLVGIIDHYGIPMKFIRGNKFTKCDLAIVIRKCPEVVNNLIDSCDDGIEASTEAPSLIQNNTITHCGEGISGAFSPHYPMIVKNIIHSVHRAISIDLNDSLLMSNNLIYDVTDLNSVGVGRPNFTKRQLIENNTISGNKSHEVLNDYADSDIRNNVLFGGATGILAYGSGIVLTVSYNDLWDNIQNYIAYGGASIDTSLGGNIYFDPMFVDGSDYHLQYGSPCIDAGDPNIKDPDSSRSDIGCYGGPWGETYSYQDYPPKAPDSLEAKSLNDMIVLSWKPNTEFDLSHYVVYKSTSSGFIPDSSNMVGQVPKDSVTFRDYDFVMGNTYYYRISAWDLTGHESEYSDELAVLATEVGEYTEEENRPPVFQLFQNYPNPFNSSTVIWYHLPDVGYQPAEAEITVYNLLGKVVRTLVKTRQYPGQHKALWDGKDDSGKEVASGIYFYRLKVSGLTLVKPRKMVLLR
jgi:hypothetical protein